MKHKKCGGTITEDWLQTYEQISDDGKATRVPALRCNKCWKEILGDADIDLPVELERCYAVNEPARERS